MIYSPGIAKHICSLMLQSYTGGSILRCYHDIRFPHGSKMCAIQALYICAGIEAPKQSLSGWQVDKTEEQVKELFKSTILYCGKLEDEARNPKKVVQEDLGDRRPW